MLAFKSCFTTKGVETSSVKPVEWRTEKPLTKGSETSSVEPVLYVRRVTAQSPSYKDGNEGHREVFASLNDRKVHGQIHVCAQNVLGIARLKLSMFSDGLRYYSRVHAVRNSQEKSVFGGPEVRTNNDFAKSQE